MTQATAVKRKAAKPTPSSNGRDLAFKVILMGKEGDEFIKQEHSAASWDHVLTMLKPYGPAFKKGLSEIIVVVK